MTLSRHRKKLWLLVVALGFYISSYSILAQGGYYTPLAFGLISGPEGAPIMAPKQAAGSYLWHPFDIYEKENGKLTALAIFYYPLIQADSQWVHRPELADTKRYPVKNYFDRELMEYRDITPD